jgi:hypothetical protein
LRASFFHLLTKKDGFWIFGSERYEIPGLNYSQYSFGALHATVLDIIDRAELENDIRLTRAAREMRTKPILETLQYGEKVEVEDLYRSIQILIRTMADQKPPEGFSARIRNSRSVIRAFYQRFCNIPPFCSPREG